MTIKDNFIIIILIALQSAVLAAEQGLKPYQWYWLYCTGLRERKKKNVSLN